MAGRRNVCAWRAYCHRCGRHSEPKRSRLLRLSSISVNPGAIFIPCGDKARGVCGTPLAYNVFCSVGNEGWGGGGYQRRGKAFGNMQSSELLAQK